MRVKILRYFYVITFIVLSIIVIFETTLLFKNKKTLSPQINNSLQPFQIKSNADMIMNLVGIGTKNTLIYATVKLGYQGGITELKKQSGIINNVVYERSIRLRNNRGSNLLLILKEDLKHLEVYEKILGINKKISFDDLNIGDEIILEVEKDMTDSFENGKNTRKMSIVRL